MSKYGLAKAAIEKLDAAAKDDNIDVVDAQEALVVSLVQTLKELGGVEFVRGVLKYELESLGSGGLYEIQRGGGHS
jgi:hypothetical protein